MDQTVPKDAALGAMNRDRHLRGHTASSFVGGRGWVLNRGRSVFAQLLEFFPFSHFEHLIG